MKNILTRGGIEFIAVLLGLTGSLWFDDYNNNSALNDDINKSLMALNDDLEIKLNKLVKESSKFEEGLLNIEKVIVNTDLTLLNHSELDNIFSSIINHWIDDYNHSVYKSMEASGIIYSLKNTELRNNILKLYSGQFSDLSDAINYNLNVIKKLDDIMNRDFELRDNKRRLAMLLNWDNPINIAQFQNNIEFRNLVITSRNIKLWVLREINETIKEVKFSQKEIIKYLNDN